MFFCQGTSVNAPNTVNGVFLQIAELLPNGKHVPVRKFWIDGKIDVIMGVLACAGRALYTGDFQRSGLFRTNGRHNFPSFIKTHKSRKVITPAASMRNDNPNISKRSLAPDSVKFVISDMYSVRIYTRNLFQYLYYGVDRSNARIFYFYPTPAEFNTKTAK